MQLKRVSTGLQHTDANAHIDTFGATMKGVD